MAYLISNQKQREFWARVRSREEPRHLRSHDVPNIHVTPELELRIQQLIDTSGMRYARLKRSKGESIHDDQNHNKTQPSHTSFWSQ
jgi:hypothetical protein